MEEVFNIGIFDAFSGMGSTFIDTLYYLIWLVPIFIVAVAVIIYIRNKKIYKYKVRIFRVRENNKVKEVNFKGGYIKRTKATPLFRIKTGMFPWNIIELTETPKVEYMDEEDRVYYKQIDVYTFIQIKRIFHPGTIDMTPVESDVKFQAVADIQEAHSLLMVEPAWKKLLPYFGLTFVGVVLIVGYAILLNTKCP